MSHIYGAKWRHLPRSVPKPSGSWTPPAASTRSFGRPTFGPPVTDLRLMLLSPPRLLLPAVIGPAIARLLVRFRERLWPRMALWLAFFGMALGGCASSPAPVQEVRVIPPPTVPPTLLACQPEPMPPDPSTATQRDVAVFLFDLAEAGQDCRRKLGVTRRLLDDYAKEGS